MWEKKKVKEDWVFGLIKEKDEMFINWGGEEWTIKICTLKDASLPTFILSNYMIMKIKLKKWYWLFSETANAHLWILDIICC